MADRKLRVILEGIDRASPVFSTVRSAVIGLGAIAAAVGAGAIGRELVQGLQAASAAAAEAEEVQTRLNAAVKEYNELCAGRPMRKIDIEAAQADLQCPAY